MLRRARTSCRPCLHNSVKGLTNGLRLARLAPQMNLPTMIERAMKEVFGRTYCTSWLGNEPLANALGREVAGHSLNEGLDRFECAMRREAAANAPP